MKKFVFWLWMVIAIASVTTLIWSPNWLQAESIKTYINQNSASAMVVYTLLCVARCFTLIPATVFILAGIILFPQMPWFVFIVSLSTVLLAAILHFKVSDYLGFSKKIQDKFGDRVTPLLTKLQKHGFAVIFLWTVAPFTPSDLAYYAASIAQIKFRIFFSAVLLGATILLATYIFLVARFFL